MGYDFAGNGSQAATADDTIWNIASATTIRPELFYFTIGSAVIATTTYHMEINRTTGQGTAGTTPTPQAFDPDHGVTAKATFTEDHSSEPTYTSGAILLSYNFGLTNNNGFQWYAAPHRGFLMPSTADNGLGMRFVAISGGTDLCQSTAHWNE